MKSSKQARKTKNLSIDFTEDHSPIIQHQQVNLQSKVNVEALHQELYLDILKQNDKKVGDLHRALNEKENNILYSDLTTPIGLTEILEDQLSDLTMIKSQKNHVSESQTSEQRDFTKFVRDATAAAKKRNLLNCDQESRESNQMSMPSTVHQSKRTSPQQH